MEISKQGSGPFYYTVEFKGLKWIQAADATNFRVSISDPLNFIEYNPLATSEKDKFTKSKHSSESGYISVTNKAGSIEVRKFIFFV